MNKTRPFSKKKKRSIVLSCVAAAAVLVVLINVHVIATAVPLIVSADEAVLLFGENKADCILVLGASVSEYGPSLMLADRLDKGLDLFELGISRMMLLSGDNGTIEYNEVQAMKDYVLKNGADIGLTPSNIYLDYAGFSTYDSLVRAKDIFGAESVVIVTQRYHLYRAVYIGKTIGLDVIGVAAKDTAHGQAARDLREIPARFKDFILSNTGFTPRVMGDPVPLDYPSTQQ